MNTKTKKYNRMLAILSIFTLIALAFPANPTLINAQAKKPPFPTEVDIKVLSAEILRFDKAYSFGLGKKKVTYNETMVLKLEVSQKQFDSLPPSIEPFLYIGGNEYRVFDIERKEGNKKLTLSFHVRNWPKLKDNAPIVLTTQHGVPIKHTEQIAKTMGDKVPRFKKSMIIDKRK